MKYCAGNWKLNKTPDETKAFIEEFRKLLSSDFSLNHNESLKDNGAAADQLKTLIFFLVYNLVTLHDSIGDLPIEFGPQNIYYENSGAFTGEISPSAAKSIGSTYALIGHSERRTLFNETDEDCHKKVQAAIAAGLTPMLCIGESLAQRESNQTQEVVLKQLKVALMGITSEFVVAYEPVWAIGTGKVATPEQAEDVHKFIREQLGKIISSKVAESTSILYGGSVKADNAKGLAEKPNIDGFLIGGASLNPADFYKVRGNLFKTQRANESKI
ncbi:MAG: triose-phosphate isomerase [Bdellovibrionales bacterium]|nr:triose-phosphate isomerase [Bdellovibrionales bacterium]